MRVLITNNTLAERAGSELYVRDVAMALLRRGHHLVAYSTRLGPVADELRAATVPVIDNLADLAMVPDIIHGHHHLDAMTAMLRFPHVPAVYFCHGWAPWEEMAPRFPTIRRYVAVDDLCQERLQCVHGIAPDKVRLIRNFVDLERFQARDEMPRAPKRALVFSNYMSEFTAVNVIREACAKRGISLDVIGRSSGHSHAHPEHLIPDYDIVFAKGRCALEALAVGCAVIACDASGLGGMVTSENYDELRRLNFGIRSLHQAITVENIGREIERYDPEVSHILSLRVRSEAGLGSAIEQILAVYQEALDDQVDPATRCDALFQSASDYLHSVSEFAKGRYDAENACWMAETKLQSALSGKAAALAEADNLRSSLNTADLDRLELQKGLAATESRLDERNAELTAIRNSRLGRCMNAIWRCKMMLLNRH